MVLRRTPLSTGVSESSIIFFNGGHNHNGISSALIDTSKYSLYDFTTDFLGTQVRRDGPQATNYGKFKEVVARIVKEDVLTTAGIQLLPNQVKANNIAAGSVTATSLAANIVLVNNIISSSNFDGTVAANGVITSQGTAGWAITSAGSAVFANTTIRGTIAADSIEIDQYNFWESDGTFSVGSNVNNYGLLFQPATGDFDIRGHIYAFGGQIAGWVIDGNDLSSGGAFDGEMVIGPGYGPATGIGGTPSGAMFVSASYSNSFISEINYNGLYTSYSLIDRVTSGVSAALDINAVGIAYQYGYERFEFKVIDGDPYIVIDGTQYPLTIGAGEDAGGESGGGGGGGGGTCSTCNVTGQEARAANCGGAGCFEIWELRSCAAGCTCDGTCVDTKISDCTGPNCGQYAPTFFAPPSFFAPPDFFAPPAFK
jgi:hypothetical protein